MRAPFRHRHTGTRPPTVPSRGLPRPQPRPVPHDAHVPGGATPPRPRCHDKGGGGCLPQRPEPARRIRSPGTPASPAAPPGRPATRRLGAGPVRGGGGGGNSGLPDGPPSLGRRSTPPCSRSRSRPGRPRPRAPARPRLSPVSRAQGSAGLPPPQARIRSTPRGR